MTRDEVGEVVLRVSEAIAPEPRTVLSLLGGGGGENSDDDLGDEVEVEKLLTPLPRLNAVLRGGIHASSVTELVGFSGAGKTQLSLTLATLTAADPELFGMEEQQSGGACRVTRPAVSALSQS